MKILTIAHHYDPLARFIATAFQECFIELGYEAEMRSEYESGYDISFGMYAHSSYGTQNDGTYKIAYNWESLSLKMWHRRICGGTQFDCIWDCDENNLQYTTPGEHLCCPIGYHEKFELPQAIGPHNKIAFIGNSPTSSRRRRNPNSRKWHRRRIIESIEKHTGTQVWYVEDKTKQIHTEKLSQIIHNTDVHLNIHNNPHSPMFESLRVIAMLLSNRKFVISEPSRTSPLIDKEHYIETNDFSNVEYYLQHPEECKEIAQRGYDFIKAKYKLIDHVAECFDQLPERVKKR